MRTVTVQIAKQELEALMEHSILSHEELNIASNYGSVVMIPQDEYDSMMETLRLFSDKKSLKALIDSHMARDSGILQKSYSTEEVFSGVQD